MFLQETKTKRGGKTYISYLVRESYRTANGPRGRTICNLTHLPKEVRDLVAQALKGEALVPLERLEVNNIHSFGGCVVLEDAAKRYGMAELLAPLTPRNACLIQALVFGGLLFPPSIAPFYVESRSARLAMFCGLDPDRERFDLADLAAAMRELDERWPQVTAMLTRPPHGDIRAVTLFQTSAQGAQPELGALGMDADGIPMPLVVEGDGGEGLAGILKQVGRQSKGGLPLLALCEETAARIQVTNIDKQPYLVELSAESLSTLLRQLNQAQLQHALRSGAPVEARHHGQRYILSPAHEGAEAIEAQIRMGSVKDLSSLSRPDTAPGPRPGHGPSIGCAVLTNVAADRLPAGAAIEWAIRARQTRAAFLPVQIVLGAPAAGEGALAWRNHQNLQLLTHRLRCHLHGEWRARGEARPVEEVLRDLQEVHRATLTVNGAVVRRTATNPSRAVSALLTKLGLWTLFESGHGPKKQV